jgi:predicted phage terminase large subunit-like protein
MAKLNDQIHAALLRTDFYRFMVKCFETLNPGTIFQESWYLRVIAADLAAVAHGDIRRLVLNLPPRSLKSVASSVALVAWYLGHYPHREVVCASYGMDLALKFAHDTRTIMQSAWYQAIFPTRLLPSRTAVADFRTVQGGGRLATSIGGPLTGRGADLGVVDDPGKPDEMLSESVRTATNQWLRSTFYSRLNDKENGSIVLAMQRLHVMDMTGFVIQEGGWTVRRLPAIAEADERYCYKTVGGKDKLVGRKVGGVLHPARESLATLVKTRAALGSYLFAAQYQQNPMAPDGNIVKLTWFGRYDELPASFDRIFQSWDTASKTGELNSYSVCTTWGLKDRRAYLLHVFRERLEYPDLKRAVVRLWQEYHPDAILVEDKSSGMALLQELAKDGIYCLKPIKPEGTKEMRMSRQTAMIEGGGVLLPRSAFWLPDYETELMLFPIGEHTDQVDSTSQALQWVKDLDADTGLLEFYREENARRLARGGDA